MRTRTNDHSRRSPVATSSVATTSSEVLWVEPLESRLALSGLGLGLPIQSALPPILAEVEVNVGITVDTPVANVDLNAAVSTAGIGVDAGVDVAGADVPSVGAGVDVGLPVAVPAVLGADPAALVDIEAQVEAVFALAALDTTLLTSPLGAVSESLSLDAELNAGTPLLGSLGSTVTGVLAIPAQTLGSVPVVGNVAGDVLGQVAGQLGNTLDRASGAIVSPLLNVVDGVVDGAVGTILPDGQLLILDELAAQLLGENVSLPGLQLDIDLGGPEAGWDPTDGLPGEGGAPVVDPSALPPESSPGDSLEAPLPVLDNLTGGAIGGPLVVSLEEGDADEDVDEVVGQAGEDSFVVPELDGEGAALETSAESQQSAAAEDGQAGGRFADRGMSLILAAGLGGASVTDSAAELAEMAALAAIEDLAAFEAALEQFLGEMSQLADELASMGAGLLPWMLAAVSAALGALEIVRRERKARLQRQADSLATIGA